MTKVNLDDPKLGDQCSEPRAVVTARGLIVGSLAALCMVFVTISAPASAATTYVDGISDQSLPYWDNAFPSSYFAGFFRNTWVGSPPSHIKLARYVLQWNVMSGNYATYRAAFEAWLTDIGSLGLTPDLALTSYEGDLPKSSAEYRTGLDRFSISPGPRDLLYAI
jgi:hypothetical protein